MPTDSPILTAEGIRIGRAALDRADAIGQVGTTLLDIGAVDAGYLIAMHERERSVSTYVGAGVAIPHGTPESRRFVRRTSLAVVQFPGGVDWGGQEVRLCVGIAANDEEQVDILSVLAELLLDEEKAEKLVSATDRRTVLALMASVEIEEKIL